jgi:hypothetical protein
LASWSWSQWYCHLLIEEHADQQREGIRLEQLIGRRILDQLQLRHPNSLELRGY